MLAFRKAHVSAETTEQEIVQCIYYIGRNVARCTFLYEKWEKDFWVLLSWYEQIEFEVCLTNTIETTLKFIYKYQQLEAKKYTHELLISFIKQVFSQASYYHSPSFLLRPKLEESSSSSKCPQP